MTWAKTGIDTFYGAAFTKEVDAGFFAKNRSLCVLKGPYTKLFNKSVIDTYNLRFLTDLSLGEDTIFVLSYLATEACKKVVLTDYVGYHYVQDGNPNSLVHKCHPFETQKKNLDYFTPLLYAAFEKFGWINSKAVGANENAFLLKQLVKNKVMQCFVALFHKTNKDNICTRYKKFNIAMQQYRPLKSVPIDNCQRFDRILRTFPAPIAFLLLHIIFKLL